MATLIVKISQSGTTYDVTGNSLAGHVWLSVDLDGAGPSSAVSMGFAPTTDWHGWPLAPGRVYDSDDQNYLETYYTGTIVISQVGYETVKVLNIWSAHLGFYSSYPMEISNL